MNQFSISQLSQFSGIKAHTIRVWEQRYQALQPLRSEGNTRYYTDDQLRRLLNIVSLSKSDYKISKLCRMTDEELFNLRQQYAQKAVEEKNFEFFISQLIAAGMKYDEGAFDKIVSHCLLRFGMVQTYTRIFHPMLERIGLMWTANAIPPSQEHFISGLVCQKLYTALDAIPPGREDRPCWLLFLPENEFHEIGILFASYLIRNAGHRVVYLGANVPRSSVSETLEQVAVDYLLTFFVHRDMPSNIKEHLEEISDRAGQIPLLAACPAEMVEDLASTKNIHFLHTVQDLEQRVQPIESGR